MVILGTRADHSWGLGSCPVHHLPCHQCHEATVAPSGLSVYQIPRKVAGGPKGDSSGMARAPHHTLGDSSLGRAISKQHHASHSRQELLRPWYQSNCHCLSMIGQVGRNQESHSIKAERIQPHPRLQSCSGISPPNNGLATAARGVAVKGLRGFRRLFRPPFRRHTPQS